MKILVVDDDRNIAQTLQCLFSKHYSTVDVATSKASIEWETASTYDLLLLRITSAEDLEFCQQLRTMGVQSLILLFTSEANVASTALREAEVDDTIVLPCSDEELLARVQALLASNGSVHRSAQSNTKSAPHPPSSQHQWWTDRTPSELAHHQAEAAIRDSEEHFRNMADHAPVMLWMTDATGYCTFLSQSWYEFSGQTEATGLGFGWLDVVHPDDRLLSEAAFLEAKQHQAPVRLEYRLRRHDGEYRWAIDAANPWFGVDGEFKGHIGSVIDISDRRNAEEALQQQILQEQLIADIAQDIRRSLDLNNVLSRTVERVREFLQTDRVIVFRFRPDWLGEVIMESVGNGWASILSTVIADPCFRDRFIEPYRQGRISTLSDIDQAKLEPCYVALLKSFQVKASLVVPILQGEHLWGLLIAHHCAAPRQWQPSEMMLLRRLANQVGIAIQQSELYEQTRQELSERQRMQTVLEESEERFRTLSTIAPIGICQTNADGICLYTNAYWQEMSGLSFEDSLGNGWMQAVHPDDRSTVSIAWEAYFQGQREDLPEFRLLTPKRAVRWVSAKVSTMRSATGEIIGYVWLNEDITDRKLAEQKIREQAALLDIASDAIFVRDLNDRILYWNQGAEQLYGWQASEAIGQNVAALLKNRNVWLETVMTPLLESGEWRGEIHKATKTGKEVIVEARWTLVRDEQGQPKCILSVDTDVTERKQLEVQFYRAQRLESLGTLASGIAHDLNNVLTPILAISQLLRLTKKDLDERSQEMLRTLEDSAKRGANMVKQILTFTKGTGGDRVPVQIAPLLQDVVTVVQQTFPKSIKIHQTISNESLWQVSADPTHLHQVLMNLCVNARDAMPYGGTLTLSAENFAVDPSFAQLNLEADVGDYVIITVSDTGTGIPPAVRDRIFEPFFTTKEPSQGTGLGLSTVLGIVKSYGGFLQVFSEVGKGTQIQVYLPTVKETRPEIHTGEDLPSGQGELVLIVDDDPAVQQTSQELLSNQHYQTVMATDGAEAIELFTQRHSEICLVLMDIMMPNVDGITAIRHFKRIDPSVKIIATSGLPSHKDAALKAGASLFLTKPYTLDELLGKLHDLIQSSALQR